MERPREKLLAQGPEALTDAELLAVLFGTGTAGQSAIQVARSALDKHLSLRSLLATNLAELSTIPGLGVARYVLLQAAVELGRRATASAFVRGDEMCGPGAVEEFLKCHMQHHEHEVFAVLFLDNRHRMLAFERLFYGTIDGATVHARQVIKRCLHHNAAAVIFSHNHPSGVAEPSEADVQITNRLREALNLIDVRMLDHIVIGAAEFCSMAELGYC